MNQTLFQVLSLIIPLVFAIVFHEVAHGLMARALGDPTAAERDRLSLNPLRHVDPIGTLVLPGFLALIKAPVFGWAKPVPIDPRRLRDPRWGMVLVGIAGPAANIALVLLTMVVARPIIASASSSLPTAFLALNLVNFIQINLFLAAFNMLPVPPFDGSRVLAGFLPDGVRQWYQGLDRYAIFIMLAMLVLLPKLGPQFDVIGRIVAPPVDAAYGAIADYIGLR